MRTVEEVIAHVLHIDPAVITDITSPADLEQWDSFNGLLLVTELEKNFHVTFTFEEVIAVKEVADIKKTLRNHGIKIPETHS